MMVARKYLLKELPSELVDYILEFIYEPLKKKLFWSIRLGKDVFLYGEGKRNAVAIIERNWLLCRYDPKYKMCEKVPMHSIEDVYTEAGRVCDSGL